MLHIIFALGIALAPTTFVLSLDIEYVPPPLELPGGMPPNVAAIMASQTKGQLLITTPVLKTRKRQITVMLEERREVERDGRRVQEVVQVPVTREVTEHITEMEFRKVSFKDIAVYDLRWRRLEEAEVMKRLSGRVMPVIAVPGRDGIPTTKPDPLYLQILKDDTLIVVTPGMGEKYVPTMVPISNPEAKKVSPAKTGRESTGDDQGKVSAIRRLDKATDPV